MTHTNILLQQLKDGSYTAFNSLYEEYFDLLYGFVFSLTRSHDATKDIVQETFIKVWVNRHKIETTLPFKPWLYLMAKNYLLDQVKKQFHSPVFEDYLVHASNEQLSVNPDEEKIDFDNFRKTLESIKMKLPQRQAEIFTLCKEQGLPASEVARQLNISEQAVYNSLSRTMKFIRTEMAKFSVFILLFFNL
ncbi:MAG: sigma-70 family RNA polymerase sigma factor [Tannerella sp.]|jgi:RNA polymerase sigma-70 factor (ECF subfamily)|nr:sigma-70 family RNA polymerase sigma factor [Tannerella sp.]